MTEMEIEQFLKVRRDFDNSVQFMKLDDMINGRCCDFFRINEIKYLGKKYQKKYLV